MRFLNWKRWDADVIKGVHGDIEFYRDLYDGKHVEIFPRAKELVDKGEVVEVIQNGKRNAVKLQPPYIVANVSKLVVDIPATLVSRSIGMPTYTDDIEVSTGETLDELDEPITKSMSEIVEDIHTRSRLQFEHWTNITQHLTDGGLVGVVVNDDNGLRIDTKARDIYFPHKDGNGCDLVYQIELITGQDNKGEDIYEEFLHIHREYVENSTLYTEELLYSVEESGDVKLIEDLGERANLLEMDVNDIEKKFPNRDRTFVVYWANNKTFRNPLGQSDLINQESKQDEINWTLTRNAIVFQRNGKPRIAVSKEIFASLQQKAFDRYGDESKIDSDDLELTTFDDKGKAIEVIQVDITKIGDISWVKDLMKMMFVETKTSEKAVDFYLDDGGGGNAQSGIAKFYDLFVSIMKSEKIAKEYIEFLQELYENALYFAEEDYDGLEIKRPHIPMNDMIPTPRKERIETEKAGYEGGDGIQSLYTSIKRANPTWTDEQIQDEMDKIEEGRQSTDTRTLTSQNTIQGLLDNRDAQGNPIQNTDNTDNEEDTN